MSNLINIIFGLLVLFLGIPIGNFLAKYTRDESQDGQKWFRLLVFIGLVGGVVGLITGNDVILFSFFFIAVVTSRSLKKELKKKLTNK